MSAWASYFYTGKPGKVSLIWCLIRRDLKEVRAWISYNRGKRQSLAQKTASAKTMIIGIFNIFKKYQGSHSDYRSGERERERECLEAEWWWRPDVIMQDLLSSWSWFWFILSIDEEEFEDWVKDWYDWS